MVSARRIERPGGRLLHHDFDAELLERVREPITVVGDAAHRISGRCDDEDDFQGGLAPLGYPSEYGDQLKIG
jgi:hypothetical protein